MEISKEKALDILEFIIDSGKFDLSEFKSLKNKNHSVSDFSDKFSKLLKYINMDDDDSVDFIYHLIDFNLENIENNSLSSENIIMPELKRFKLNYTVVVDKQESENWEDSRDGYSEKSIYWDYMMGYWHFNDGDYIDSSVINSEISDYWFDSMVPEQEQSIKEHVETNQQKVEKLLKMKKIIENKIKELS
jgi:hypothetical protein